MSTKLAGYREESRVLARAFSAFTEAQIRDALLNRKCDCAWFSSRPRAAGYGEEIANFTVALAKNNKADAGRRRGKRPALIMAGLGADASSFPGK
jgi:hypothetical protein